MFIEEDTCYDISIDMLHTFIFIGRSGCGKGTQAALLEKYLRQKHEHPTLYLETGSLFREFIKGDTHAQELSRAINKAGGLQPEFLTVNLWGSFLINNAKGKQQWIIDGTPRKLIEATMLESALTFFERSKPTILWLNVSRDSAEKRLLGRKRADDTKADIEARLDWYETDVVKTIEYYKSNPKYEFIEVNGDQSIDDVHKEILAKTGA